MCCGLALQCGYLELPNCCEWDWERIAMILPVGRFMSTPVRECRVKANGWYHSDFVEILPTILEHRALKSHGVGIESFQLLFRSKRVVR